MTTMSSATSNSSNGTQPADSSDALAALDTSDVPRVGARELALALKMLSGRGLLFPSVSLSDDDLRRVEQAFWQISRRGRQRKVAVLLRFRSLMEACQSRRINDLIARHGQEAVVKTLEIAARMKEYAIVPEFSFVVGNPPDPEQDVHDTLEFIRQVKRVNAASEIILYLYTPVPLKGSLYEDATASGFRFPETLDEWTGDAWREFSQRRSGALPWMSEPVRRTLHDFERVLNAYYPTVTDRGLSAASKQVLRALSAWRYRLRLYRYPVELRVLQRLIQYQRPETSGF